ncbi:hypothetical protein FEZ63_12300 [Microvirga brassicacearum]|uniref:DUF6894 domain-containing protein n=2 Tax=Microvirga brassicacearum TaxID=2580413 RepID=A0A5N3PAW4_9HYPH|nr:hypothetical protein FEZ63_12300 [Microvirga brassicacearum]
MRCYFDLVGAFETLRDGSGIEVSDLEVARAAAWKAIQELREGDDEADQNWSGWALNIVDPSRNVLVSMSLIDNSDGPPPLSYPIQ